MKPAEDKIIKVLVVEDSRVVSEFITHVLNSDPNIQVVGAVSDGSEALEAVRRMKPNVITMDIHMPRMNGFDATRSIMETCPTPIIIVSGSTSMDEVATNFEAVEAGALAVVARPNGLGHQNHHHSARQLVETVKLMSEVKVVRRWNRPRPAPVESQTGPLKLVVPSRLPVQVVAIGASTGGPLALQAILSGLSRDIPVPVLIVQHMTPGFTQGFVEWLARASGFPVKVAADHEALKPGQAYVAPDGFHMGASPDHHIVLSRDEKGAGLCPSVSFLFRSIRESFGKNGVGVLLTGMGTDGVDELKKLKDLGTVTIAQDEESSIIHGMPGQAIKAGAVTHVLSLENIARALNTILKKP